MAAAMRNNTRSISTRRGEKKRRSRSCDPLLLIVAVIGTAVLIVAATSLLIAVSRHSSNGMGGGSGGDTDAPKSPHEVVKGSIRKAAVTHEITTNGGGGGGISNSGAAAPAGKTKATAARPPPRHVGAHGDGYQLAFSTDCGDYQRWQSYLMFHSAMMVGQPGYVTRIASGCTDEEAEAERTWHDLHVRGPMSDRFRLHLTPHFSKVKDENGKETGKDYSFFNKPFGLRHWLEHGEGLGVDESTGRVLHEDDIVILVDPDQILLKPITEDFSDASNLLLGDTGKRKVEHGAPFAQLYGFGGDWKVKAGHIPGPDSPVAKVSQRDAATYYPAGPPYVGTGRDMHAIAVKWTEYVPAVHKAYPHLLAEMYGYCLAAAHLELPHQIVKSLMVSDTSMGKEGWPLLDRIPAEKMCDFGTNINHADRDLPLPYVMHFCQRYMLGKHFFGKRRLPKDFLTCKRPLLIVPPSDLGVKYDYRIPPPPHKPPGEKKMVSKTVANREAFMLCSITAKLNDAATFFKEHYCKEGEANLDTALDLWNPQKR